VKTLRRDELEAAWGDTMRQMEEVYGMLPNSTLLMAYLPGLYEGLSQAARAIQAHDHVPEGLKWMVGHMASSAAGCRYCWAHSATYAVSKGGIAPEKMEQIFDFETSPLFSDAERAALRVAKAAGAAPNATTEEMFEELRRHFDDRAIVQMVGMIALYGFMNRWNDTLAPQLEPEPRKFAEERLTAAGWTIGPHE
jgi:alkylhydroperoxidase family enzyme